jgi:hypothetical protein
MRVCFAIAVVCAFVTTGAVAGDAGDGTQSVLVNQPAPAATAPKCDKCAEPQLVCVSGQCTRLYNAESHESESCRNRLFGGTVVRKNSRTVYKPVRR